MTPPRRPITQAASLGTEAGADRMGLTPEPAPPSAPGISPWHCLVTAGPTFEPLDSVRRLTNFSTGRLGSGLAIHLAARGAHVTLLLGELATWPGPWPGVTVQRFSTTQDLAQHLQRLAQSPTHAVFHAAAVSDFRFGRVWRNPPPSTPTPHTLLPGKLPSTGEAWLAELVPTSKIIRSLRPWFPNAFLVGWKYEVDGTTDVACAKGLEQLRENATDACVVNGPAYGTGYGLLLPSAPAKRSHCGDTKALFQALELAAGLPSGHSG